MYHDLNNSYFLGMIMLIRLLGTLVQGSNQSGSKQVAHPSKGVFLMARYCILQTFSIICFISGDSASYFLGMIMP